MLLNPEPHWGTEREGKLGAGGEGCELGGVYGPGCLRAIRFQVTILPLTGSLIIVGKLLIYLNPALISQKKRDLKKLIIKYMYIRKVLKRKMDQNHARA